MVGMLAGHRQAAVLLLSFALPFLLFISNTVPAARYLNPVIPVIAIGAGYAVQQLVGLGPHRFVPLIGLVITAAAALPGLDEGLRTGIFFRRADTRTLAQQHIETTIPPHTTILVQPYTVQLTQSRDSLKESLQQRLGSIDRASRKFAARLALEPYPGPAYRTFYLGDGGLDADKIYIGYGELGGNAGLRALRTAGVQYIVVRRYNTQEQAVRRFRDALNREAERVAVFSPYPGGADQDRYDPVEPFLHNTDAWIDPDLARPGPVIEIWKLRGS
jgi:hypothetical protein